VRVGASSICGTDVRIIKNGQRKLSDGDSVILGHEFAGVVEKAGAKVAAAYPEGTRVGIAPNIGCGHCIMCARGLPNMCPAYSAYGINMDGAHTELVRVAADSIAQGSVFKLDDALSFEDASLIEPLSCALNGSRAARIGLGDTVLIFGAGPIGMFHIDLARLSGAACVVTADLQDDRLEQARERGADVVINPGAVDLRSALLDLTDGLGADVVITACSVAQVQAQALELLAPFGRVCFFGGLPKGKSEVTLDTNLIHYRNLLVTGTTGGAPKDFHDSLKLVQAGRVDVRSIVSHRFAPADMGAAFETAINAPSLKVVISHNGAAAS
jgi:threonine dehydrogenase-like Zn-dependent dehydrogenase